MKKLSMALLVALLSAGFVSACSDDKKDDDPKTPTDACAEVKCDAIANANGVAKGDDCVCEYTCKLGFDKVDGADGAFTCEASKNDCSNVTCNAIANANGVAKGDDCACEYTCNSNAEKVDDPAAAGKFKCLLKNDEVCNGNDECASGNCESLDDETSKCAAPKDPGNVQEGTACNPADANPCENADALCIGNVCKTADDLNMKECASTDAGYCFGNVKVNCVQGDNEDYRYIKDTCATGSSCVVKEGEAKCELDDVDPTVCSEATEGNKLYSCGGEESDDEVGAYLKAITKTCTNNSGTYEWVESAHECNSYSGEVCWPNHASTQCTTAYPGNAAIGDSCNNNIDCVSDYCNSDKVCAEKPAK